MTYTDQPEGSQRVGGCRVPGSVVGSRLPGPPSDGAPVFAPHRRVGAAVSGPSVAGSRGYQGRRGRSGNPPLSPATPLFSTGLAAESPAVRMSSLSAMCDQARVQVQVILAKLFRALARPRGFLRIILSIPSRPKTVGVRKRKSNAGRSFQSPLGPLAEGAFYMQGGADAAT